MSVRRLPHLLLLTTLIAGCAAPAASPPPPPPSPGAVLPDWRAVVTATDRDRLRRTEAAWGLALEQARRGSPDRLRGLGDLADADARLSDPTPPVGDYRCRLVRLGSQDGAGPALVSGEWSRCRVEATAQGLRFSKLGGTQRPAGLLFPEDEHHMVLLGGLALASEPPASRYGRNPARDLAGRVERIAAERWRIVLPWPQAGANLDLIELIPAG